jgi:Ser/Thr protein kinase RdoA (MazF antagonist)
MSRSSEEPRPPDAREAADAFGLGRVLADPLVAARGEMGRIWRLETSTGRWALKEVFRPAPDAADRALIDAGFQEAALAAGVPMPRPVRAPDGRVLIEVGPPDDRRFVRVYSWVDLRGRDAVVPLADVGAILGRLHGLAIADPGPVDPWYRDPVPADRWPELVARASAAGAPWTAALERLVPDLVAPTGDEDRRRPATPVATITCHLDYNPENVLLDSSGQPVVVDWENCGAAFAEQELASAVAEFVFDPLETAGFLRAYEEAGGTARIRDRSSFAMTLIVQARLVRLFAERALDPAFGDEDRARSAYWVEDIAAHVFTLDRIDRWLDAADRGGLLGSG